MKHPSEEQLALFAGGELSLLERWIVQRHVSGCAACEAIVQDYRDVSLVLREELNRMPERLNWERLAAEMTANIRVGVAAGECVAPVIRKAEAFGWRTAAAIGGAAVVVIGAWFLNVPASYKQAARPGVIRPIGPDVTLQATEASIELRKNGSQLVLMHPNGNEGTALYGSAPGSLRVSFVDKDTGQVTINRVYAD